MTDTNILLAQATELTKRWGDGAGLQPFSFTLSASELVVVRGRSGSGKSTLLSLLAGWIAPDAGSLVRLGPWASAGVEGTWRGTAILPQVIAPIAELTMTENVALPLRLAGTPRLAANSLARVVLAKLGLTDEADRAASDSSLGQQQRMALARAAVIEPIVMLADEPTSHQDAGHIFTVLELLREMVSAGSCIVVASHDAAVAEVADRVLDLDRAEQPGVRRSQPRL
ncbi:MAG: ATP-binding cassette domain-containing protein [Ilumatobacteraceae bacterium]